MVTTIFSNQAHRQYLDLLDHVGDRWLAVFDGNTEFYSGHYWELLTTLWAHDGPMRKTGAIAAMKTVRSAHTAGKYLEAAIQAGMVIEETNPKDARSRLVSLSGDTRVRLDGMFDDATAELCASADRIAAMRRDK